MASTTQQFLTISKVLQDEDDIFQDITFRFVFYTKTSGATRVYMDWYLLAAHLSGLSGTTTFAFEVTDLQTGSDHDQGPRKAITLNSDGGEYSSGGQPRLVASGIDTGHDTHDANFQPYIDILINGSRIFTNVTGSKNIYWETGGGGGGGGTTKVHIYYQDGSTAYSDLTQEYNLGSSVQIKPGKTKSGYTFTGWKNGNDIYTPGQWVSFNGDRYMSAQWSQTVPDGETTNNRIIITASNSNDVLFASTSGVLGTEASGNGSNSVTVYCNYGGVSRRPSKVELLPTPDGTKFPNSFAIRVVYDGYAVQEIAFGCADNSVNGANWVTSTGVTLTPSADDVAPARITVSRYNTSGTKGTTVTKVTLNDYWVANYGLSPALADESLKNTTVGSYTNPATWYWHYNMVPQGTDPETYEKTVNKAQLSRTISWTKPSSGTVLYYVIMLWKGYSTSDERGDLGSMLIADGGATSIVDDTSWWGGTHKGYFIKYTVHAVYAGGPNPSFKTGTDSASSSSSTGLGKSQVEDWAIWWQWATNVPTIRNIKFYENDKTTLLKDSNGIEYDYYAPEGSLIKAPADIRINGVDYTESYKINGWYKKVGSGSWGTTLLTNLGTVGTSDLSFYQSVEPKTCIVTYYNTESTTTTRTFGYGTVITINNDNGSAIITVQLKDDSYTIPKPSKDGYSFKGFSYNSTNKSFTAMWEINNKKIWVYTGSQWQQGIPWIYDGSQWKQGKSAFIYNSGWKEEK